MAWRTFSLVVTLALLAGCLGDGGDADPDLNASSEEDGPPAGPVPGLAVGNATTQGPSPSGTSDDGNVSRDPIIENIMLQTGCQSFYSSHRVDAAYAEARLPEGLSPFPYDAGGALLTLKSWTCPESIVDNESIASGAAIVYYIAVEPDAAYDAEHVGFSWYPLEIVTASDDLATAFTSWGFTVASPGDVSITWDTDDPWLVMVAAQGEAAIDARVTVPSFGSEDGTFTVRYFAGDGGRVTSAVDIVVHPGTRGGNGPTAFHLDGEHAPGPAPLVGTSGYQGWETGALSYTWTPVSFPASLDATGS